MVNIWILILTESKRKVYLSRLFIIYCYNNNNIITIEWLEPRLIFKFHQIKIFILKPKSISTILKYINIHSLSNINFNRILLFTV